MPDVCRSSSAHHRHTISTGEQHHVAHQSQVPWSGFYLICLHWGGICWPKNSAYTQPFQRTGAACVSRRGVSGLILYDILLKKMSLALDCTLEATEW